MVMRLQSPYGLPPTYHHSRAKLLRSFVLWIVLTWFKPTFYSVIAQGEGVSGHIGTGGRGKTETGAKSLGRDAKGQLQQGQCTSCGDRQYRPNQETAGCAAQFLVPSSRIGAYPAAGERQLYGNLLHFLESPFGLALKPVRSSKCLYQKIWCVR
jgi:hypothetical protein